VPTGGENRRTASVKKGEQTTRLLQALRRGRGSAKKRIDARAINIKRTRESTEREDGKKKKRRGGGGGVMLGGFVWSGGGFFCSG